MGTRLASARAGWRRARVMMGVGVIVAGCSGSAATSAPASEPASAPPASASVEPTASEAQEPIELRVLMHGNQEPGAAYTIAIDGVVEAFEAANPNVNVVIEPMGNDTGEQLRIIDLRVGGGDSSVDVYAVDYSYLLNSVYKGYLEPLNAYFSADDLAGYVPSSLDAGTVDGTFYAAPRESSSVYLYVNRDLLREVGVEPPPGVKDGTGKAAYDGAWTFEQVIDAGRKVVAAHPEKFAFRVEAQDHIYMWQPLAASLGGSVISADGLSASGHLDGEGWIKAATWYQGLIEENLVNATVPSWTGEPFFAGNEAFFLGGGWNAQACADATFDCDVAAFPYFADGKKASPTDSWHLGVSHLSEHKDAAAALVKFWTLDPAAQDIWTGVAQLASSKYLADLQGSGKAPYDAFPLSVLQLGVLQAGNDAVHRPRTAGYAEYDSILTQGLRDILALADATETMRSTAQRIDRELQKYAS